MANRKTERSEERKNDRRNSILQSAVKIFTQKGYNQTTVKDIVEDAGVSIGTFYLYFKSKEDIFETLFDIVAQIHSNVYNEIIAQEGFTAVSRFCRITSASLWAFERYRDLSRIMLVEAVGLNPRIESKRIGIKNDSYLRMNDALHTLQGKKLIDIPDEKIGALVLEGASLNVCTFWLLNAIEEPLRAFAYAMNVFMLQALGLSFEPNEVKASIEGVLSELDAVPDKYTPF